MCNQRKDIVKIQDGIREIEDSEVEEMNDLEFSFRLPNDIHFRALFFLGSLETKMSYSYFYHEDNEDPITEIDFANEITLDVQYINGYSRECVLSWNMTNVSKLGKEFYAGVDISPGAKLFVQFFYERRMLDGIDCFQMKTIRIGVRKVFDLDKSSDGLPAKIVDLPFPLNDRIIMEFDAKHGLFQVPILTNEGEIINIGFKGDIKKILRSI